MIQSPSYFYVNDTCLFLGNLDEGLTGVDLFTDETDDLRGRCFEHLRTGAVDLKAGVFLNDLGRDAWEHVSAVHTLGLVVKLHDAKVGHDHLRTAVAGKTCALASSGTVHPAAGGDVVHMVDEAALLMLHHDDGVAIGGNAVCATGAGEAGGGLEVVALAE